MKIRTQDCSKYMSLGECFVAERPGAAVVCVRSEYSRETVTAGIYGDMARARGVMEEIMWAYKEGDKIFYMPAE